MVMNRIRLIGFAVLCCVCAEVSAKGRPMRPFEMQHKVRVIENVKTVGLLIDAHPFREDLNAVLVAGFLNDGRLQVVGADDLQDRAEQLGVTLESLPSRSDSQLVSGLLGERGVLLRLRILNDSRQRFRRGFFPRNQALTRMTYQVRAEIQVLKTGKRFDPQFIEVVHEVTDSELKGTPRGAVAQAIRERSLQALFREVLGLFLPVTERVSVYFFNDKKCNMRVMAEHIEQGDMAHALDVGLQAAADLEAFGEVKVVDQSRLHFNIGALYLFERRFDKALYHLERAFELEPIDDGLAVLLLARRAATHEASTAARLEEDRDQLLSQLRRLKGWRKDGLIDVEEYREQRMSVLQGYQTEAGLTMAERLAKARALYEEKLISEKEYKLLKNKIFESVDH
ncbi:Tetratricopeptide repeat protein [Acanthopleuribacter pedis]